MALVTKPGISLSQTNKKVDLADSITHFLDTLQFSKTNKKCDSTFRTGLSRNKVEHLINILTKIVKTSQETIAK